MSSHQESKVDSNAVLKEDGNPKRILLVEDNDSNRQMMDDYLCYWGYQVLSLANGFGFFQALADFEPHLILLDLKLPDIDGYLLLEQLQQTNWRPIPIFVISAFAFAADKQRALSLGASRYFVKPINLIEFLKAIEEELSNLNQ